MAGHVGNSRLQARSSVVVQVAWTRRATADLVAIAGYIAQFSPASARRISLRLKDAAAILSTQPDRGRLVDGTIREPAAVRPYIIRHRISAGAVRILRIRHSARRPLGSQPGFSEAGWGFLSPFDEMDESVEARMIAEAEADVAAGRVISNQAMMRWIKSWAAPDELQPPECSE